MKWLPWGVGVLVMIGLAGCRTASIRQAADPEADLSRYRTFAILPIPADLSETDPDLGRRVAPAATSSVQAALVQKGYRELPRQQADFVVNIRGKTVPVTDVTSLGYLPEYGRMGWTKGYPYAYGYHLADVRTFEEGTLIIEVYDNRTRKMVWVGWTSTGKPPKPEREGLVISNAIQTILAQFPSAQPSA